MTPDASTRHSVENHLMVQLQEQWSSESGKLYVGLSGGADSTALLVAAVNALGPSSVTALHANHNLHTRSGDWAMHCRNLCAKLQVELVVGDLTLAKGNVEAAARAARYDFFRQCLQTGGLLLLGHHQQDQLETVLMRLIQGRSLVPMREQGKLGQGRFFRPLLAAQRQQLLDYLASNDVLWLEDPSNQDQSLTRNFLRHRVIQPLLSRWPGVADAVVRVAQRQQAQYSLLQELLADAQDQVSLNRLPESRSNRRVWLRVFLELRGHFAVTDKAIDEFCRQLNDAAVSRLALDSDSTLLAWRDHLYYESAMGSYAESPALEQTPLKPGEPIVFAGRQWSLVAAQRSEAGSFCCSDSLSISARRADLVMQWHGRQVGIDDLLRDLRIPPWRRASVPLVINEREIVAVADLAVSERYLPGIDAQSYWRLESS